jgi:predicted ATP-grasp superfamily ATP-dependent carboligase
VANPPAIVVGLDCITGLQTARLLASRGVPVVGVARDPDHFCARTRVCERILTAETGGDELIPALERLASDLAGPAVLVPCTDAAVLALSRGRERLPDVYRLALPDAGSVELLMNKLRFAAWAEAQGFPVPRTFRIRTRAEALDASAKLAYPATVKPAFKTAAWQAHSREKAYRVESAEQLLALYERCADWTDALVAQEWVEGGDENLYSCNCYFGRNGSPLASFVARKIRQWPPRTGTSSLGEEVRNDEVLDTTLRLFQAVDYRGLGYVEMKRDAISGRHVVIEPNVGRPTGRSAIAEAGGVELLYTMYCDLIGRPLPALRIQRYGDARWIYWRHDLQSAFHYWRRGELGLREWARSWRGRKACAVFSVRDPLPFLADATRSARLALSRLR